MPNKQYTNISQEPLKTPKGQDWPSGQVASLTDDEARPLLAYKKIQEVPKKKRSDPEVTS